MASRTLCSNPTSKIAKDNLETFVEMWKLLMEDVRNLSNEVTESCQNVTAEKQVYTSLPRPGVSFFQLLYHVKGFWDL